MYLFYSFIKQLSPGDLMTKYCVFSRYINDMQKEVTFKRNSNISHKSHRCLQLTVLVMGEDIRVPHEE